MAKKRIQDIEGIGPVYAEKLASIGITTVEALLEEAGTPQGRKSIAERLGLSPKRVLEWVNHADLYRIKGVGSEYADLLEAAGVDTVVELAHRNPESLYAKLEAVNREKNLVRRLPSPAQVRDWVEQAKALPRKVFY